MLGGRFMSLTALVVVVGVAGLVVAGWFGGGTTKGVAAVKAISVGAVHNCALLSGGSVKCWGGNRFGELGSPEEGFSAKPVEVDGLPRSVIAVAAGDLHTCALLRGGSVKCWGWSVYGQLGDGKTSDSNPLPLPVAGLERPAVAISAANAHTCALLRGGKAKCWGDNEEGQLGNGTTSLTSTRKTSLPGPVEGLANAVAIAGGWGHTCALLPVGTVECWGDNAVGQLGTGTTQRSLTPTPVKGL